MPQTTTNATSSSSMASINILSSSSPSNAIAATAIAHTYYPFTNRTTCNNTTPIIWNDYNIRWSSKINNNFRIENLPTNKEANAKDKKSQELFPIKVKNMQGCPVYVATFDTPPFLILYSFPNGSYYLDGIEGILMRVLSQRFNFVPVVKIPPNNTKWGVFDRMENGKYSANGAYGMILDREANITIGSFGVRLDLSEVFDASEVYYQSKLVLIIPPGKPYSSFQKLFRPFDFLTWITLGACFSFGFIFIISLEYTTDTYYRDMIVGLKNRYPFFNMVIIFFGGAVTPFPVYTLARSLLIIWMLGSLVLRSLYQGSLYTHLQQSTVLRPYDTIQKLIDNDYLIYAILTGKIYFENWPKIEKLFRLHKTADRELMWEKLRSAESKFALLSTEDHVLYANVKNYSQGIFQTTKDPIRAFPVCAYFPHSSYLTGPMSAEIGRYLSSGLIQNWAGHFTDRRFRKVSDTNQNPEKLKVHHILGSIFLCGCFYFLALITFGLEILSRHNCKLCSIIDFITY